MDAGWIQAMLDMWKNAEDIDFAKLEAEYRLKPLDKCGAPPAISGQEPEQDSLLVCLTGFGEQRQEIADLIIEHGARYTGDLTRKCSHLIVSAPEGKKFTAAKSWGVNTVTLAWLYQSIERGMILEESKFDPLLPAEAQGQGAWVKRDPRRASLGKRSRSSGSTGPEEGVRKLRKTASMKLSSQRNNLWGDILGRSTSREYSFAHEENPEETSQHSEPSPAAPEPTGIFAHCIFFLHGFRTQQTDILEQTISSLDGTIAPTLKAAAISPATSDSYHRFLVVPQSSQAETHPISQYDNLYNVTEFYIERCLHNKTFFHPDSHTLGRPFPSFPIRGFADLTICSAAFTGLELSQVARSVKQLGANFDEEFRRTTSVLVCRDLSTMRKDKLKYALEWAVPVVSADWLWECISTGFKVPISEYIYPELKNRYNVKAEPEWSAAAAPRKQPNPAIEPMQAVKPHASRHVKPEASTYEDSAADVRPAKLQTKNTSKQEPNISSDIASAISNPAEATHKGDHTPLSELSSASVNKSPSPSKSIGNASSRHKSESATDTENSENLKDQPPAAAPNHKARVAKEVQKEQEEARQAAKASERQRLTSRITSLLDSAKPTPPMEFDAAAAGSAPAQTRPRKRQILGRAISNVSNASSAASGPAPESMRSASALGAGLDEEDDGEEREPPSTQLEYRDPQAMERKAMLMSRMMSGEDAATGAETAEAAVVVGEAASHGGRNLRKRT